MFVNLYRVQNENLFAVNMATKVTKGCGFSLEYFVFPLVKLRIFVL